MERRSHHIVMPQRLNPPFTLDGASRAAPTPYELHMSGVSTGFGDILTQLSPALSFALTLLWAQLNASMDNVTSFVVSMAAAACLIRWSSRYSVVATFFMAIFSITYAMTQYRFWAGDELVRDVMRLGEVGMGLMLMMPLFFGPKRSSAKTVDGGLHAPPADGQPA